MLEERWNEAVGELIKKRQEMETPLRQEEEQARSKQSIEIANIISNALKYDDCITAYFPTSGNIGGKNAKVFAIAFRCNVEYKYPVNAEEIINILEAAGYGVFKRGSARWFGQEGLDEYRISSF